MKNDPLAEFVGVAAIIVVLLPLVAAVAIISTHVGFGVMGMTGVFGPMGVVHTLMLLWTLLAAVIVGALVALVLKGVTHA